MKRIYIILFILFCTVFNVSTVMARDLKRCQTSERFYPNGAENVASWVIDGGAGYGIINYKLKDIFGNNYTPYCRQPALGDDWGARYCITGKFFAEDNTEQENAFEAGIVTILKNGYSAKYNNNFPNNNVEKAATNTALRVYELLWTNDSFNIVWYGGGILVRINQQLANELIADYSWNTLIREAIGYTPVKYNAWADTTWASNGVAIKTETRRLIKLGLEAAKKYRTQSGSNNGKIDVNSNPKIYRDLITTDKDTQIKSYKTNVTYKLDVTGFKSPKAYIKPIFTCDNCNRYGITYKFYINNQDVGTNLPNNLTSYTTNGAGKIEIRVEFTGNSSNYNCQPLSFVFKLSHFDDSDDITNNEVFYVQPEYDPYAQSFFMLYKPDSNSSESPVTPDETVITDTRNGQGGKPVKLCNPDCDDLKIQCDERIPGACDSYEEECSANCNTYISNAECTIDDSEIVIEEGHEIDPDTCVKDDKVNIQKCIINKRDKLGNSYKAYNLIENNYCTVSCKEDYHILLPGQKETNSGRYFTIKANIKGTKSCYTSKIDRESFNDDLEGLRKELVNSYNVYNSSKTRQNENVLKANIKRYENLINEFNNCSMWVMEYNFNPKVKFNYQESYMTDILTNKNNVLSTVGDITKSDVKVARCTSDTNDTYESCSTGWVEEDSIANLMESVNQYICYKSGSGYACGNQRISLSKVARMKASIEAEGNYAPKSQFYTIFSTGAVAIGDETTQIENSAIINGLPVGLRTGAGVYTYSLQIEDLGEYYDKDKVGRIWGADKSLVSESLKEKDSCVKPGAIKPSVDIGSNHINSTSYVCSYKINCPTCAVTCDDNKCYNPDCPDNNCTPDNCASCSLECDGCMYNNGASNVTYRPITTDSLNPNNRELGFNWQHDDVKVKSALELKAYATSKEIVDNGNKIYDLKFSNSSSGGSSSVIEDNSAIHVKMDNKMIKKILEHNDLYENNGGYSNNSLECYDYVHPTDGKTYKNIYCYSTFLDKLLKSEVGNNIQITTKRILGSSSLRKANTQKSGYWTTWTDANSNKWTITTEHGLGYGKYQEKYDELNIGPSWK